MDFWIIQAFNGVSYGALLFLLASGLSLIFGVMRLVNIAHADLLVLAAYLGLSVVMTTGLDPLTAILVVVPMMAIIGYGLQRGINHPSIDGPPIGVVAGFVREHGEVPDGNLPVLSRFQRRHFQSLCNAYRVFLLSVRSRFIRIKLNVFI